MKVLKIGLIVLGYGGLAFVVIALIAYYAGF